MGSYDEYVAVVQSAFETVIKSRIVALMVKLLPWFGGGIGGMIAGYVAGWIAKELAEDSEMAAFFKFIDVRTSQEGRDWYATAKANRDAQRGNASPEEKKRAEDNLIYNHKIFVKWSSNPAS